ncbi:MAG: serine/threonine-protein kinase [Planctomycetia bacterium]|nr:serine/threonine-protein kinase [Planctomycetia bacterium]
MTPSAEQLGLRAVQIGLISERELRSAWAELGTKNVDLETFSQLLIRRELLTNYQVERLKGGHTTGFFFGNYKVLYLVGRGTFARVYRAISRTGEVVAIKVLRTKYSDNPESYTQFQREGELGKVLQHPNIISIKDVQSQGKIHFIAMEFVEGQSLRDFVRIRGKLTAEEALPIMRDIAAGLQFACEHGMTHRDLKLTNVMIASDGVAKLADFGFATVDQSLQVDDDLTIEIPNQRTVDYAGLERTTGVKRDDTRSDIYFAGCIYYHLLAGVPPLSETKDRLERMNPLRFQSVIPLQNRETSVPLPVAMIVNKAMSLDVRKRYQTPGEMLKDIRLLLKQLQDHPGKALDPTVLRVDKSTLQHSIMVVEKDGNLQEVFREALKKMGFRVLMTTDPKRAIDRFYENPEVADCMLINAQNIGEEAVEIFNELPQTDQEERKIPAVLLLAKNQAFWKEMTQEDTWRVTVQMPVTMRHLALVLTRLLGKRSK